MHYLKIVANQVDIIFKQWPNSDISEGYSKALTNYLRRSF